MKWIGQHIYDLVARFRNDVYLEDIQTGTIASGGNLGLNSNNKIVKQSDTGITDLHGAGVDGSADQLLTDDGDGTVTSEANLTFDGETLSTGSLDVSGTISGTLDTASQPNITTLAGLTGFGATGVNTIIASDDIQWYNNVNDGSPQLSVGSGAAERLIIQPFYDSGAKTIDFVKFNTITASSTANKGQYTFQVDSTSQLNINDSGLNLYTGKALTINGENIISDSSGTATLSNIDALDATTETTIETAIDTLANLTAIGTAGNTVTTTSYDVLDINRATNSAEDITALHIDFDRTSPDAGTAAHNDIGIDLDVTSASLGTSSLYGMDIDVVGATSGTSTAYGIDLNVSRADTNYGMFILSSHTQLRLSQVANNYADFNVSATGDLEIDTVGSGTTDSDITLNADGDIIMDAAGGDVNITSDTVTFTSANADDPAIWIQNTANDDQATRMIFLKNRGADGQDGDECGAIYFYSYDDGTPSTQQYGYILSTIHDATSGQESGKLDIGVANHDGGTEPGVSMQGGSANGEVDVTIGSGTDSLTTIAGDLGVTTGLILDSVDVTAIQTASESFADNDTSLMTSAAIDDAILKGGSVTTIKLLPKDFMMNEDGGVNKSVQYDDTGTIGVRAGDANGELYAFVEIPIGKTATSVVIYGNDTNNVVEVFEADINASGLTDKTPGGGCVVGSACDMTDVAADATNYLAIKVTVTATSDIIYGGAVTVSG